MKLHSILLASALLAAAPAHAATYIITYTGTVYDSFDQTGVFGGSGSSLDGLGFTAVYTLTAPLPGAIPGGDGSTSASIFGGSVYSAPSPVSAKLTINRTTREVTGNYQGFVQQDNGNGGTTDRVSHLARDSKSSGNGTYIRNTLNNYIVSVVNDLTSNVDYKSPLSYTVKNGDMSYGSFSFESFTDYANKDYDTYAYGNLRATSVTIAPLASAVPEPATWALMILGFGLLGGVMRQQRRKIRLSYG